MARTGFVGNKRLDIFDSNTAKLPGNNRGVSHSLVEKPIIIDDMGQMDTTWEYVKDNPDWFDFIDVRELNGIHYYYYRLRPR